MTIKSSTINGNTAAAAPFYCLKFCAGGGIGGGVFNNGTLTITNSTLFSNSAKGYPGPHGGGIHNQSPGYVALSSSTLSGNISDGYGGGIDGSATLQNSIVAYSPGGNCAGTMTSNGYNVSSDATCNFSNSGDRNNIDPKLGPLQNNGGPTQTMALLPGSPAIDAGNPSGCTDGAGHLLKTDQRGKPRPNTEDIEDKKGCDMGAYERQSD